MIAGNSDDEFSEASAADLEEWARGPDKGTLVAPHRTHDGDDASSLVLLPARRRKLLELLHASEFFAQYSSGAS